MEIKIKNELNDLFRPESDKIDRENQYRFDRNERTFYFDSNDFKKIINEISNFDLIAYPNLEPLYKAIAKYHKINRNQILLASGGDYAIRHLYETYLTVRDNIVNTNPNYAMYSVYAKMFGVEETSIEYDDELLLDIKLVKNSIKNTTKIIIISNPGHNGIKLNEKEIIELISFSEKKGIIVLIDEAYIDFTKGNFINHVNKFSNLIILRTMSKGFGIASLRVSYLISSKKNIANIFKVKPAHEISGVSAKIAKYLFENTHIKNKYLDEISKSKKFVISYFKKNKIDFLNSHTNFIYFKTKYNTDRILLKLKDKNIFIKNSPNVNPFKNYLRLTLGNQEQMEYFIKTLDLILYDEK